MNDISTVHSGEPVMCSNKVCEAILSRTSTINEKQVSVYYFFNVFCLKYIHTSLLYSVLNPECHICLLHKVVLLTK